MANTLPTTMEYFDNLLGEQLTDGEGGGGSSDFSTAHVRITNNSSEDIQLYLPVYFSHPQYGSFIQGRMPLPTDEPTFEGDVVIPVNGELLVGANFPSFTTSNTTVTGNATVENGELSITGDCTITIS